MVEALLSGFRSLLFPLECAGCHDRYGVAPEAVLCARCVRQLPRLPAPLMPGGTRSWDAAAAPFRYCGLVRDLISAWKYRGQTELDRFWAGQLAQTVQAVWNPETIDAVVPIPLHKVRLRERSFDQAGRLAAALAACLKLPIRQTHLRRQTGSAPQVGLSRPQRKENLRDAFQATQTANGEHLLLVDDVLTTGATAEVAAAALKAAGAAWVGVITVAQG